MQEHFDLCGKTGMYTRSIKMEYVNISINQCMVDLPTCRYGANVAPNAPAPLSAWVYKKQPFFGKG